MKKTARYVPEKVPSCENCQHYRPLIKKNKKGIPVEFAHGTCIKKNAYKQRHEICKKDYVRRV